jgi:hypothetical protein
MAEQHTSPAPWAQQQDEPNRAFEHFLYFLHSQRPRNITKAYKAFNPDASRVSDMWWKEAKTWQWEDRALAYDVEMISKHGQRVVADMVSIVGTLAERVMDSLNTQRGEAWTYEQTITAIRLLSELIPAETVAAIQDTSRSGGVPAIGTKPVTVNAIVTDFTAIAPRPMGNSEPSGEAEGGVQWPALGKDNDGRGAVDSSSSTGGESVVDSAHV